MEANAPPPVGRVRDSLPGEQFERIRYFEDVPVGEAIETPARTVTEADLVAFAGIAGDHESLDQRRGDASPPAVVPDLLIITLISGLGFRIPVAQPQVLAFMVVDWRFLAPVRIGDTVHCRIEVTTKRGFRDGGVLVEKRKILNQRGEVVQEGEYKLMVARRPRS